MCFLCQCMSLGFRVSIYRDVCMHKQYTYIYVNMDYIHNIKKWTMHKVLKRLMELKQSSRSGYTGWTWGCYEIRESWAVPRDKRLLPINFTYGNYGSVTSAAFACRGAVKWSSKVIITGKSLLTNACSFIALMHFSKSTGAVKVLNGNQDMWWGWEHGKTFFGKTKHGKKNLWHPVTLHV